MKILKKKLGIAVNAYEVEMSDDERRELICVLDECIDRASAEGNASLVIAKFRRMRRELVVES